MKGLPFPSNENAFKPTLVSSEVEPPWRKTKASDPLPNMFKLCFSNGSVTSFSYGDLRETRLLHAGQLVLCVYGMEKYHVIIRGRNLGELADLIECGRIKAVEETGPRTFERPEDAPSVDQITIDTLTGPN